MNRLLFISLCCWSSIWLVIIKTKFTYSPKPGEDLQLVLIGWRERRLASDWCSGFFRVVTQLRFLLAHICSWSSAAESSWRSSGPESDEVNSGFSWLFRGCVWNWGAAWGGNDLVCGCSQRAQRLLSCWKTPWTFEETLNPRTARRNAKGETGATWVFWWQTSYMLWFHLLGQLCCLAALHRTLF